MADAPDSKSGRGNPVRVQVPPPAPPSNGLSPDRYSLSRDQEEQSQAFYLTCKSTACIKPTHFTSTLSRHS
jgi:hypothetical protein